MNQRFNFEQFPVLETERLILREIVPDDAEAVFAIRSDYEVTKYNTGEAYTDMDEAQDLIDAMIDEFVSHQSLRWGIVLKPDSAVIGMVGYNYWHRGDHRGSVGFDLAQAYWRKGIMFEALKAVLEFGFSRMMLNRIEADASIYNTASINLMKKAGFQQEGIQRQQYYENGSYHDLVLFGLLKSEWVQEHSLAPDA